MSLGIFTPKTKAARPLAPRGFGLPAGFGLRGALGASNLPGTCWDVPGFKTCHAAAWKEAQQECEGGLARDNYGGDVGLCIDRIADANAWAGCVGQYCPQSTKPTASGATTLSWRNTTPNSTVKKLQNALNPYLKKHGANQLTVDGILGSGTCGAAYWIDGVEGTSYYTDYGLAQICQTTKMPTKAGTTTPIEIITVIPRTTVTKDEVIQERADLPWGEVNADTAAVQSRLNLLLDSADMNLLATDGRLNAPTCGAMKWAKDTQGIDLLSVQGQNCQGFTAPTKRVKTGSTAPSTPSPTGPATIPSGSGAGVNAVSMAKTGLILGALGVGVYFAGKKLNWF